MSAIVSALVEAGDDVDACVSAFRRLPGFEADFGMIEDDSLDDVDGILYDVVRSVLEGTSISRESLSKALFALGLSSRIVDVLWIFSATLERTNPEWKILVELSSCIASTMDQDARNRLVVERIELPLLADAGLLPAECGDDENAGRRAIVRTNTNLHYLQRKFNLRKEEPEGFAKLDAALKTDVDPIVVSNLVGTHRLDPNRVVDLVLDHMENESFSKKSKFLPTLALFDANAIAHVLGRSLHVPDDASNDRFDLCVYLLSNDLVSLDALMAHMSPGIEDALDDLDALEDRVRQSAKLAGVRTMTPLDPVKKREQETNARLQRTTVQLKHRAEVRRDQFSLLLAAAYRTRNAAVVRHVLQQYDAVGLRPFLRTQVVQEACDFLDEKIRAESESEKKDASWFCGEIAPLLLRLKHKVNPSLLAIVVEEMGRALDHELASSKESFTWKRSVHSAILLEVLCDVLLGSLATSAPNPYVSDLVWTRVLSKLPGPSRFDAYERFRTVVSAIESDLLHVKNATAYETKQILKRVAKEKAVVRLAGRKLAKLSHANPLIVMQTLLDNVASYANLIPVLVDAFRYFSELTFDVLVFLVVANLASKRWSEKLGPDGVSKTLFVKNLSLFGGCLIAKYPNVDPNGALQHVLRGLKASEPSDLLLLERILSESSGIEVVEQFSERALESMCGGPTLRRLGNASTTNASKTVGQRTKAVEALVRSLSKKVGHRIVLLLAKQRTSVVFPPTCMDYYSAAYSKERPVRLAASTLDECTASLLQLAEFARSLGDLKAYTSMCLPEGASVEALVRDYGLEPVLAFHLCRPTVDATGVAGTSNCAALASEAGVSESLYGWFWNLSNYDVHIPSKLYEDEIRIHVDLGERLGKKDPTTISSLFEATLGGSSGMDANVVAKKVSSELVKVAETVDALRAELAAQSERVSSVSGALKTSSVDFFPKNFDQDEIDAFFQRCIAPRCVLSEEDAAFCARWIATLVDVGVATWAASSSAAFRMLIFVLQSATEREASIFAVFYRTLFATAEIDDEDVQHASTSISLFLRVSGGAIAPQTHLRLRSTLLFLSRLSGVFPRSEIDVRRVRERIRIVSDLTDSEASEDVRKLALAVGTKYDARIRKSLKKISVETTPAVAVETTTPEPKVSVDVASTKKKTQPVRKKPQPQKKQQPKKTQRRPETKPKPPIHADRERSEALILTGAEPRSKSKSKVDPSKSRPALVKSTQKKISDDRKRQREEDDAANAKRKRDRSRDRAPAKRARRSGGDSTEVKKKDTGPVIEIYDGSSRAKSAASNRSKKSNDAQGARPNRARSRDSKRSTTHRGESSSRGDSSNRGGGRGGGGRRSRRR